MNAGPRIDSYEWSGGREPMLRIGPEDGPVVVLALPLFEEANRTRAFGVSILRALAERGVGGVLPELPAQGESALPTDRAALTHLREAMAAAPGTHSVAIRSGALVLNGSRPHWLLSPQTGPELLRELARIKGSPLDGNTVEVAGNIISRQLLSELAKTERLADADRIVRLAGDVRLADLHTDGPSLWRRVEPDDDPALAQTLAADIADWIAACEA